MRRKGTRTITSSTEAATAAPVPASLPTAIPTTTSHDGEAFPAVSIPTLDIFARFQNKRDDFDANWLMLEEDALDKDKAPPISEEVAGKLKRHQALLSTSRGAAGSRSGAAAAATVATSAGTTALVSHKTSGQGIASTSTLQGGADFDKTAAEVAAATAPGKPRRTNPMNDESEEDDLYVPEGKDAVQYRKETDAQDGTVAKEGGAKKPEAEAGEEGMQGDFLNFLPKNPAATASNPNANASDLLAVVSLGGGKTQSAKEGSKGARGSQPQSPTSTLASPSTSSPKPGVGKGGEEVGATAKGKKGREPASSANNTLVVPLWSAERVRRFGGYYPFNRLVALHQEVCDLVDFLRPTQAEVSVRRHVELQIQRLTKKLWPKCRVIVYGSLYTHLLLPLSDVDMTLVNLPSNVTAEEALTALATEISQEGLCQAAYPQVILKTKVPLIKFQHKGSLIDIDISVNAPDGKSNSDIVISLLNLFPEARPLILVVKYFLQQRDMHEPYHGGLGSYATTLLVINFLQTHPIYTTRTEERPVTGLGKLLVDFFRYCGAYWRYQRCGIALTGGGHFFRRADADGGMFSPSSPTSPRSPLGPPQAIIEDPLNSANNAASSLRNYHMISSVFSNAYQALTAPFPTAFEFNNSSSSSSANEDRPGAGSRTATSVTDFSPDAQKIALRPTLLSRVLHVDADTVYRRQSIATAYAALQEEDPEGMAEVEKYRADEDAPMLTGEHKLRLVSAISTSPTSPVTKEEAMGLATLSSAASRRKRGRDTNSASSSTDGDSSDDEEVETSGSHDGEEGTHEDSGSNASSVRLDVSKPSRRKKQMSRHS